MRVQVTDAVIKVQGGIHEVFSWQPVSGLVQPWPRKKQPNEYQLGNGAVGTLLKLVHAHNYTQHTHTQACHWERSCGKMTKVCKDKPIRHQEKLFSANLENIKM